MRQSSICLIGLTLFTSSCASIMTGKTDTLDITSNPSGATYVTNTGQVGTTPGEVTVPEEDTLHVDFSHAGYRSQRVTVESKMSNWIWGNLLFGGLIGLVIDVAGDRSLTHDNVHADLEQFTTTP